MENILNVAQYIFSEYKNISREVIDEMKLHKLLYLTQRESYAIKGGPMFNESFEGWRFGPVSRELRNCYTSEGLICDNLEEISDENAYIAKSVIL